MSKERRSQRPGSYLLRSIAEPKPADKCSTQPDRGNKMYELEATVDMIPMSSQAKASIEPPQKETAIEFVLVKAVLDGDREAFGRLYDLYAALVHGILLARVPRAEVDDLVQDIFFHAFKKLHTLRDWSAFGPWVAMIARNRAMDFHRRSRATVELSEDLRASDSSTNKAVEILELIRGLPDAYRETLALRLVEGMTGPEIANRTGLTPASVRVNLHRGLKLLREKLRLMEGV
jgi:RNA polymerase sigma-70 factor, ECF subfamily